MIRNFTNQLFLAFLLLLSLTGCEDELSKPAKSTLTVDKTTGLVGDTEFTFSVTQVNANTISLLPYGLPGGDAGIQVKSFSGGVATIKFKYAKPGTYNAIVVSNNRSDDGKLINTQSDPVQIIITSDNNSITEFKFDKVSTETTIDQGVRTIAVTVPYGTNLTKIKATFTASAFSEVSVDGSVQSSGSSEVNFTNPVTYRVKANNGATTDYVVTVSVTPIQTINTITSASAKATSKAANDKALPVSVDNMMRTLVVYDTMGTPTTNFDSIRIGYKLDGSFSYLKYGQKKLKQDSLFNLAVDPIEQFVVFPQDSLVTGTATYNVYAVAAPKLKLNFNELVPSPVGSFKPTNFNYDVRVLAGTDISQLSTIATIEVTANQSVTDIKVMDGGPTLVAGVPSDINFTIPQKIELTVNDTGLGITYKVIYSVSVTVVQ
jgi:hypothetical protein